MAMSGKKNIVIVGGGVIGCTTAYYLTRHPKFNPVEHNIILLEAAESVATGASGKAGGLLALWAYPECLVPLSYRLHAELAKEHGGYERWGYRQVGCGSIEAVVTKRDLEAMAPASNGGHAKAEGTAPTPSAPESSISNADANGETEWAKLPKQDAQAAALFTDSPLPADLDWIDARVVREYSAMQRRGASETAQVHPLHFTTAMAQLAAAGGADIRTHARVTHIQSTRAGGPQAVEYVDRRTGEARRVDAVADVVVAAGPWTGRVLPRSRIDGIRAHSVVFEADVSPYAVFTDIQLPEDFVPESRQRLGQKRKHTERVDPEIYARPFGEVYACGETDRTFPLPDTADQVQCDLAACDDMVDYIRTVSPVLGAAPIKARQACYLPQHVRFGEERGPLLGPTTVPHLWVAAGHSCWGIQNSPATGCLMAEFVFDGAAHSADVDKLDPRKFKV